MAVIAPAVFSGFWEYHILLVACYGLVLFVVARNFVKGKESTPPSRLAWTGSTLAWTAFVGSVIVLLNMYFDTAAWPVWEQGEEVEASMLGNVVGSNLFNLAAVMGLAGAFSPDGVDVNQKAMEFDVPLMVAASVACLPIFFNGYRIARWEGIAFLICYAHAKSR